MGMFGPIHGIIFLIFVFLIGFPIGRVLWRAGLSPWWVICAFIPLVNLVFWWVFAFTPWPNAPEAGDKA
jgi:hypothetical protein